MAELAIPNIPENLELHPEYLMEVSLGAMKEIGNYLRGGSNDFTNVQELTRILDKYHPRDRRYFTTFSYLYSPLLPALKKDSAKEIETFEDIALEIRLLQYSLRDVPHLPREQLEEMRNFMVTLTQQFQVEWYEWHYGRRRFA